ncbi:nucleotidyltransferase domain-containing protein [Desulfofundulus salinus]|uniref:Nucleotidyltransferase domain-containing protein n=1 Tax=Desulfofundulus salinus TaxID=2419843 RepID=A0A494WSY7_9FIRM|nr:nucleotidyltransferase domain-containing protein [Desulfofundulus salinum]RKO66011.1 nucleotidyltransferase domain-containing protein [Desulfofundulus salinum]
MMAFLNPLEEKAIREFSSKVKSSLGKNLLDLKLFGSKSTGKFHEESDIDILVVVNERDEQLLDAISEILLDVELKYNSMLSPVVLTAAEFLQNQKHQTLFYHEVARDGVTL